MKVKRQFPLFDSHLDLAQKYWENFLTLGDWAIDATCGNGHDTLLLSQLVGREGGVIGLDIQERAIEQTKILIKGQIENLNNTYLFCQSHELFPLLAGEKPIQLIVYNLGYLPHGDKEITTRLETTLISVRNACNLLPPGGMISLTCYPGHPEGFREEEALLDLSTSLCSQTWNICFHKWKNRKLSPSLFIFQKNIY